MGLDPLPGAELVMLQFVKGSCRAFSLTPPGDISECLYALCADGHTPGLVLGEGPPQNWRDQLPWDAQTSLSREDWRTLVGKERASPFAARVQTNTLWPCHLGSCKHDAGKSKMKVRLFRDGRAGSSLTRGGGDFDFLA